MNPSCPHCLAQPHKCSPHGHFIRRSDSRFLKRYKCQICLKTFSRATFQKCYRQKKRRLNRTIEKLFASGASQRRIAKNLRISKTTVERKFRFLALQAALRNKQYLKNRSVVTHFQFDDLETFEHSKLKPLSVIMAVETDTRKILGFRVCQMAAKGLLSKKARKKYGPRRDERSQGRKELFKEIREKVSEHAEVFSDQSPHYPVYVRRYFPKATHKTTKGRRGCVVGQGELKAGGFDPLFSLNHTFAMLRYGINRLVRKTWCTTKCQKRLADHIHIYTNYHNTVLT